MTPEERRTCAFAQHTARHYVSYRGTLDKIVESIRYCMGESAPDADTLSTFLRKESTQLILAGEYEVGLWRNIDKSYSLVSLAIPIDVNIARRRLSHFPDNPSSMCAWCYQDSKGFSALELRPVLNLKREIIQPPRYCHPVCMRPLMAMRYMVERADLEAAKPKPEPAPPVTVPILAAPPKRGPGRPRKAQP